jgi:hypothetical protein
MLFSERSLKPEELYFAVLAGTEPKSLRSWNPLKMNRHDIQRRINSSSRGLIETRKNQETVQFIHATVNDFFLRNKRLQTLNMTLESNVTDISHDRLTACCMSYFMMRDLSSSLNKSKLNLQDRFYYSFLEYASTDVLYHAEKAQERGVLKCLQS